MARSSTHTQTYAQWQQDMQPLKQEQHNIDSCLFGHSSGVFIVELYAQ